MAWLWPDFDGQWIINTYLFEQINPYLPVTPEVLHAHNLQKIPEDFGTSPWGLVLGQFFYAGWLPNNIAAIYFLFLYFGAYMFTMAYAFHHFKNQRWLVLFFGILVCPSYFYAMFVGNAGGLFALCLLWSLYLSHQHPVLAGIALSFAMIKPQMALIFCFFLIYERRFRMLFIAAAIDICALLLACFVLGTPPFQLLVDFTSCDIGDAADGYYGILTLFESHLPYSLYGSMLLGIVYATAYYIRYHDRNELIKLAPFCTAAAFWCYAWGNEMLVQLPLAMLAWQHLQTSRFPDRLRWAFILPYCMLHNYAVLYLYGVVYHFTHLIPTPYRPTYTLYVLILIVSVYSYTPIQFSFKGKGSVSRKAHESTESSCTTSP